MRKCCRSRSKGQTSLREAGVKLWKSCRADAPNPNRGKSRREGDACGRIRGNVLGPIEEDTLERSCAVNAEFARWKQAGKVTHGREATQWHGGRPKRLAQLII